ncbi:MAG: hypothetical protein H6594_06815 [Flavobacteriales bacterium]|nr:hypothetical protein [Flavobacteriales bacterium]
MTFRSNNNRRGDADLPGDRSGAVLDVNTDTMGGTHPCRQLYISVVIAVSTGILLLACTSQRDTTQDRSRFGGPTPADSLFFHIERTPCFGRCPAYSIDVYRSGFALYEGRSNVERIGRYTAWIGLDTLDRILTEADRIGYFDLQENYDAQVTDLPSTKLHIVSAGRDKAVLARYNVPAMLKVFAVHADSLLLHARWRPSGQ